MKRTLVAVLGSIGAATLAVMPLTDADRFETVTTDPKIVEFDVMAPVDGPFVGASNPIRDVNGGGLPWQIAEANGELTASGKLEVEVSGLVLLDGPPVPPDRRGINPIAEFRAVVSCFSTVDDAATTVNVTTDPAPATVTGDAEIEADLELPNPCIAPIVFVGPSAATWFAATGTG